MDDVLSIPGSFDGLEGVEILALFLLEAVENDTAFLFLATYEVLGFC